MKMNTTTNLASVVMLAIISPVLAMAILVSIKQAGVLENDVLLVLLTLLTAVLSGINGFGRRTAPSNAADGTQVHSATWSTRQSTNA